MDFWKDNIKNNAEARRCLLIAEENVENTDAGVVGNLVHVARYWIDFNDRDRAKSVLLRADHASDAYENELIWVSQMWRKDFGDIESAKKYLRKAESQVPDHNQSIVHPREVFKTALLSSAAAIILVHQHPTGDPSPSSEDIAITRRLKEAGDIIGIKILDHCIIGQDSYISFVERGLL